MLQSLNLTPRDVNNLAALKNSGLSLVEAKISQVACAKGQLLANISLPENSRLLCVMRQGRPILDLDVVFLEEQDAVYLLTDDEVAVRETFTL